MNPSSATASGSPPLHHLLMILNGDYFCIAAVAAIIGITIYVCGRAKVMSEYEKGYAIGLCGIYDKTTVPQGAIGTEERRLWADGFFDGCLKRFEDESE